MLRKNYSNTYKAVNCKFDDSVGTGRNMWEEDSFLLAYITSNIAPVAAIMANAITILFIVAGCLYSIIVVAHCSTGITIMRF